MTWPQIIMLGLIFSGVGINIAKHGEPRENKYNIWVSIFSAGLVLYILKCGGFFS